MSKPTDDFMRRVFAGLKWFVASHPVLAFGLTASTCLLAITLYDPAPARQYTTRSTPRFQTFVPLSPVNADGSSSSGKHGAAASATASVPASTATAEAGLQLSDGQFSDSGIRLPGAGALAWGDYDNDGDLDLAFAGRDEGEPQTSIYRNDGGTFTRTNNELVAVWNAAFAWGDYDNDGELDLAVAGQSTTGPVSKIYANEGGTFRDIQAGLVGAGFSALAWGDLNNDGQLDLAVAGSNQVRIYTNARGVFTESQAELGGVQFGSVEWLDVDKDGDLDLSVSGEYNTGTSMVGVSRLFRNGGNGQFAPMDTSIAELSNSSLAWADYDADGDLDVAICGFGPDGAVCKIYRNDGNDKFTDLRANLAGVGAGAVAWGDMDNDGDPDLAIAGFHYVEGLGQRCLTRIYRNDGNNAFSESGVSLIGVHYASLAWGDYDNDRDLDLAVSGFDAQYQPITRIYRNDSLTPNTPPTPPANLTTETSGDSLTFLWTPGNDAETPASGLSYNLRVGSRPGADDIFCGMADLVTGQRRTPGLGGSVQRLSWTLRGLSNPPYYWSVQAIDAGLAGSAWALESGSSWSRVRNTTRSTWHATIQNGIDAAQDGDVLVLNPGLYTGEGNWDLDFSNGLEAGATRNLTVRSLDPLDSQVVAMTVIDCAAVPTRLKHRVFNFYSGETRQTVIEGLTFRNAEAPSFGEPADGGAIACAGSSPVIRNCVFDTCGSTGRGGAIAIIGMQGFHAPEIRNCVFTGNRADLGGGAVYAYNANVTIENCAFKGNAAGTGGAILADTETSAHIYLHNCLLDANYAAHAGGAICANTGVDAELVNCTLTNNVAQNFGGLSAAALTYPVVVNSLLWGNRDASGIGENSQLTLSAALHIRYSNVQGWTGSSSGQWVSGADPLLADIDGIDQDPATWQDNQLMLARRSPCINAADPNLDYLGQTDIAGQERLQSCRVDIGAYESPWSMPPADFNLDCHIDITDLRYFVMCATGPSVPQNEPACLDADLDEDADVDADDFAILQRCWSGPSMFSDGGCID